MNDEFYIGWEAKAAPSIGRQARRAILGLLLLAVLLAGVIAINQQLIGVSVFEWGNPKTFSGILRTQPYPQLLVPRPGQRSRPGWMFWL